MHKPGFLANLFVERPAWFGSDRARDGLNIVEHILARRREAAAVVEPYDEDTLAQLAALEAIQHDGAGATDGLKYKGAIDMLSAIDGWLESLAHGPRSASLRALAHGYPSDSARRRFYGVAGIEYLAALLPDMRARGVELTRAQPSDHLTKALLCVSIAAGGEAPTARRRLLAAAGSEEGQKIVSRSRGRTPKRAAMRLLALTRLFTLGTMNEWLRRSGRVDRSRQAKARAASASDRERLHPKHTR